MCKISTQAEKEDILIQIEDLKVNCVDCDFMRECESGARSVLCSLKREIRSLKSQLGEVS